MSAWIAVILGGSLGAALRFFLTTYIPSQTLSILPILLINTGGSFCLGLFLGLSYKLPLPTFWMLFIQVGFLGSLTTFSTFIAEIALLHQKGEIVWAILYPAISIIIGLCAYYAGYFITKNI